MTQNMNPQLIAALADFTLLNSTMDFIGMALPGR